MNESTRESLRVRIDELRRRRMEDTHYCPGCQRWLDKDSFYERLGGYLSGYCRACSQAILRRRAMLSLGLLRPGPAEDVVVVEKTAALADEGRLREMGHDGDRVGGASKSSSEIDWELIEQTLREEAA